MNSAPPSPAVPRPLSPALTFLFAAASGLCVATIYLSQPLLDPIAGTLGLHAGLAGLLMSLTQLGYGAGLLFLGPLADVVENRRLVLMAMTGSVVGLAAATLAQSAGTFLAASFAIGACAVAAQVLVPLVSHLAPPASRGKVVGNVMSGLLAGIMLARPYASLVAGGFGWRAAFGSAALLMAALTLVLRGALPEYRPPPSPGYARILASLPGIVARTPLLRRRALYQGLMFSIFQVFWTAVPLALAREYGLGQHGIAAFALAGAAGALAAPVAGRLADRGLTRAATGSSMLLVLLAVALGAVSMEHHHLIGLVVSALLLDSAVQSCHVLSLRGLYMLAPELRGRLNALYLVFMFVCAAFASGSAAAVYALHGWAGITALSATLGGIALLAYATEWRRGDRPAAA